MVVRWTFFDPTVPETYTFPFNPNEGGTAGREKSIAVQSTAAPDGKTVLFEGRDPPRRIDLSGTILERTHLEALEAWFDKRHQIKVTDDLGREYWAYITNFSATRNRRAHHPWHHSYTMQLTVVDYP